MRRQQLYKQLKRLRHTHSNEVSIYTNSSCIQHTVSSVIAKGESPLSLLYMYEVSWQRQMAEFSELTFKMCLLEKN